MRDLKARTFLALALLAIGAVLFAIACHPTACLAETSAEAPPAPKEPAKPQPAAGDRKTGQEAEKYSLSQAMSDKAQLNTIAFSGLAFITGNAGADSFMPPGKVADFFGFQYMRDIDIAGYGHNTTFLSKVANNVLHILDEEQIGKLIGLARTQAPLYTRFAYNRFPLMDAFRRRLEGRVPSGADGLEPEAVAEYVRNLYYFDAELSYNRAVVVGEVIRSFTDEQESYLSKMAFDDSSTWPQVPEDGALKQSMGQAEFVALMTYASELFSWYKGGLDPDVYFCPERHGTYFGGFYMKDLPAMNNPDYFISTSTTGDSGEGFLDILDAKQKLMITKLIDLQRPYLEEAALIRRQVSAELRNAVSGQGVDKQKVYELVGRYGWLDGMMSALYAEAFAAVNGTLTDGQRKELLELRGDGTLPEGAFLFSNPIAMPVLPSADYFFGIGEVPEEAGRYQIPEGFGLGGERQPKNQVRK